MRKSIGSFVVINRSAVLLFGVVLCMTVFGGVVWRAGAANNAGDRSDISSPANAWPESPALAAAAVLRPQTRSLLFDDQRQTLAPFFAHDPKADVASPAATFTFTNAFGGVWTTTTNWNPNGFPNAVDDVATFPSIITAQRGIQITGGTITIGTLNLQDDNRSYAICNPNPPSGTLIFDVSSGSAAINVSASGVGHLNDDIECVTTLNDPLIVDVGSNTGFAFFGGISGGAAQTITKTGAGLLRFQTPVNGTHTYTGTTIINAGSVQVSTDVSSSPFSLTGGTLGSAGNGTGKTGALTATGGTVAPGTIGGIDILNAVGNVSFNAATTYAVDLSGTTVGTTPGYDQLNVTGTVTLGGSTLTVTVDPAFTPVNGNTFNIINNDGTDAITGRFAGLPNSGDTFAVGTTVFSINYAGGSNNDVVLTVVPSPSRADFDGDGKTDLSVFRPTEGNWYLQKSTAGFAVIKWGISSDVLVPGDYDGDGKADTAVFRANADSLQPDFYILNSNGFTVSGASWGLPADVPDIRDYDGDGKDDVAVFRPSDGTWYVLKSTGGSTVAPFGLSGDIPVAGDYDGDGKDNLAVFRPSTNTWYIARATGVPAQNFYAIPFGLAGDKLVPADYDGDSKDDVAVYRPSNGTWYTLRSMTGTVQYVAFGIASDIPVPGDYDGDGKDDQAVYRSGVWYLNSSTSGFAVANFGLGSDTAIPAKYIP